MPTPYPDNDFDYDDDADTCDLCGLENCQCQECGMLDDGTCMLAGTEFCDWDCPFNTFADPTT